MAIRVLIREKPDRANLLLYYVNPITGLEKSKSAGTADRKQAERAAALWEQELRSGFLPSSIDWEGFRQRFEDEHMATVSKHARSTYATSLNQFEKYVGKPRELSAITASTLSLLQAEMRKQKLADSSITTYLTHLRTALRWAKDLGMLQSVPSLKIPRRGKQRRMRGRPITEAEFQQMLDAVPSIVTAEYACEWQRMLRGMWLSGLRLEESLRLSWDSPPIRVDLSARIPRIIWHAEGHKAGRDEATPMTPCFAAFLWETPANERAGLVFRPQLATRRVTPQWASSVITSIGEAAKIVVNERGKFASAHDLRRGFGTRWAMRVRPITLRAMMRHVSIETTLRYYVHIECDDVGAELWGPTVPTNVPNEPVQASNGNGKYPTKQGRKSRSDKVAT